MKRSQMSPAERLGAGLRAARQHAGLSTYQLAEQAGVAQSQVVRYEKGEYATPDLTKVAAMAHALGIDPTELLAANDYPLPPDALSPTLYLRAKYRNLPVEQLKTLQRDVASVLARHGIAANDGPAPGEDEAPANT